MKPLFISLVFAACLPTLATREIRFSHLSLEEGLSQSTVFCMLQDTYGFMWFGTNDGLNRYDGYSFEHFKYDGMDSKTLSDSWISAMMEDSAGNLWVGTFKYGLNRLSESRTYFERIDLGLKDVPKGLGQNLVYAILEVSPGVLWVGLESHGIVVVKEGGASISYLRKNDNEEGTLHSDSVRTLLKRADGSIWVGGTEGLDRYDPETGRFHRVHVEANDSSLIGAIHTLMEDTTGRLWIGTFANGLYRLDKLGAPAHHYTEENSDFKGVHVSSLLQDDEGIVWAGTVNAGLNKLNAETGRFHNYTRNFYDPSALHDNTIMSLYQDRSGLTWLGTYSDGLYKFNLKLQGFRHIQPEHNAPSTLSGNNITAFAWEEDKLWVGTRKAGLNRFDPQTDTYTHYRYRENEKNSLSADQIRHVLHTRDGYVWVGTEKGLDRIEPNTGSVINYPPGDHLGELNAPQVMYLFEDEQNQLWVGTYEGGLNRLDRSTHQFQAFMFSLEDENSISSNLVNHIFLDNKGQLWVSTEDGINLMDRENQTFTRYLHDPDNPRSLRHPAVMAVFQRPGEDDVLWVGTYGGGLNRLHIESGQSVAFTMKDGLANDAIYGILDDEQGRLWISTNNGISRFHPETGEFRNFDSSNGLPRNEFNRNAYLKADNGELIFGCFGFITFDPMTVKGNPYMPTIALTSVQIGNDALISSKPLPALEELRLAHDDEVLFLSFASLDFNSPPKNRFAHRLEGVFDQWVVLDNRHDITYTNLSPGQYTLRVKGSNNDGVWNNEGLTLPIIVDPPLWLTKQAYIAYFVLLAIIAIGTWRYRVLDSRRELQRAMSLGKAEFATTVLHNIGNVLNSVKVGCDRTASILRTSKMKQLLRAQDLLYENLENVDYYLKEDPRGKLLPGYFKSAGELVNEEYREMIRECDEMSEQIALMKDIIETQQAHASISLMEEAHNLNQVVRDALKVQESGLMNRGILIEERLRPLPPVKVPKTQLMHIVINLVKNAREAMDANGDREKKLLLETGRYGETEVYLKIKDTGTGISRENLPKMFTYGFTTKPNGHGFGLNYCSRAMKEMGGTIEVESEGVGKGAAFTLLFRSTSPD